MAPSHKKKKRHHDGKKHRNKREENSVTTTNSTSMANTAIAEEYGGDSSGDDSGDKRSRRRGRPNSESEDEEVMSREFKKAVVQYIILDNKSRTLRETQCEINKKKKEVSEIIIGRMNDMRMKTIAITGGRLHRNKAESQAPLKKEMIMETLKKELGKARAEEVFDKMQEMRPVTTRINLKRVKDRKDGKKSTSAPSTHKKSHKKK